MFLRVTGGGMTIVHGIVASGTPAFFWGGVTAQKEQLVFNRRCAACHGNNSEKILQGLPLIYALYNPGP